MDEDIIRTEVDSASRRVLSALLGLPRDRRPEVDWRIDELRDAALGSDRATAKQMIAAWEVGALTEIWGRDGSEVCR